MITANLPKYMNDVIHVSIHKNGIYSAMPRILSLVVALLAGCVCDWMTATRGISITNVRRTFIFFGQSIFVVACHISHTLRIIINFPLTRIASVIPAFFILAASYAGCNELLVVTLFMVSIGAQGLMTVGHILNPVDLSPVFASTLNGITNSISTLTGIVAPYVVGVLTPNVSHFSHSHFPP